MVRFSDLFKNKNDPKSKDKPSTKKTSKHVRKISIEEKITSPKDSNVNYTDALKELENLPSKIESEKSRSEKLKISEIIRNQTKGKPGNLEKLYKKIGETAQEATKELAQSESLNHDFIDCLEEIINLIVAGERSLINFTCRFSPKEYSKFHLANVGLLSLYIGHDIGYQKPDLAELGLLAFLHEVEPKTLDEFPDKQSKHSETSVLLMRKIHYLAKTVLPIWHKQFARRNSPPMNLKNIVQYAKIINIAETNETLCRPPSYRRRMAPQLVIKDFIKLGDVFDKNLVKSIIKLIGIYPIGSLVKLNTGEIARVVSVNPQSPMRPQIQITFDANKLEIANPKNFDLTSNQNIYIETAVSEDDLSELK